MIFTKMGLHLSLADQCHSLGFSEPTPIQRQAIPIALEGKDLIGCAATGTGKTAAFLLPMLQRLYTEKKPGIRALILAPTRELAGQIAVHLDELDSRKQARSAVIVGGASYRNQLVEIRRGASVVIATPGRLEDHLDQRTIDLSGVEMLVLDEADRMLDMGFLASIRRIIGTLHRERQTLLFSATMSPAIEQIARVYMRRPNLIEVNPRGKASVSVKQAAYPVAPASKTALLFHLLEQEDCSRTLVFTATRRGAERLSRLLAARDLQVERIHADRTQPQREAALRSFREGRCRVLVATDIAARGIDVSLISHVINFDMPAAPEDYVHRIGRTGRAGNAGQAMTLLTPVDELTMARVEKLTGQKVERILLPDFGGVFTMTRPVRSMNRKRPTGPRMFRSGRASR
jgi:ATP-dependent RNA helicase RhlE